MSNFKQVSKEEFKQFIENYPNKLEWDVAGMCEPPYGSYNDFSDGKVWPESVVASVIMNEAMKGHPAYNGELNEYKIKEGA